MSQNMLRQAKSKIKTIMKSCILFLDWIDLQVSQRLGLLLYLALNIFFIPRQTHLRAIKHLLTALVLRKKWGDMSQRFLCESLHPLDKCDILLVVY